MKELDDWDQYIKHEEISHVQGEASTFKAQEEKGDDKQGTKNLTRFILELQKIVETELSPRDYETLSQSPFQSIRIMIALNSLTPLAVLENLTKDKDKACAEAARKNLNERQKLHNTTIN